MFSGIIEDKSKILKIDNGLFEIQNLFGDDLKIGQSIAHDGACMTIESIGENCYRFFAMQETFKKTNFSFKKSGDYFNVERSLKIGDRLDGHFVSGHIDCCSQVLDIFIAKDNSKIINFSFEKRFKKNIVEKGSISINGVSLTIFDLKENNFYVSLIPLTQKITNLGDLKIGDMVNIEFDILGKYINNLISK